MSDHVILRKFAFLGRDLWDHLPSDAHQTYPIEKLGRAIHFFSRRLSTRAGSTGTYFLRNTPLMSVVARQIRDHFHGSQLQLGVVGCSTGAEVYSFLWTFHKALPDLRIATTALDISSAAVEVARAGHYTQDAPELRKELSPETIEELFDRERETGILRIKPYLADGIHWLVGDARDPNLVALVGVQDVLLANNFLVHMRPAAAEECMTCLLHLVRPGGLFVCRGVDLSVRESVARRSGLEPITDDIQQIHDADPMLDAPKDWPWKYWGLEPMDLTRRDWPTRYAAIFRVARAV